MKKKILCLLLLCVIMTSGLTGCSFFEDYNKRIISNIEADGYFTVIKAWGNESSNGKNVYYIVYANDSKVKYFIYYDASQYGISHLYNTDGSLQIYEEGK